MKITYVKHRFACAALERIDQVNAIIDEYIAQGFKLTLRQLYYQLVSRDLIPNTKPSYKNLGSLVNDARLAGMIDWLAIEDRTRNLQSLSHWTSPNEIVRACANQYTRSLWAMQDNYVEAWVEKDALIGVLEKVCNPLDVPYFACKGYTSQSEMWGAAQRLLKQERCGKTTTILHLGDHDSSGIDMTRDIQDRLRLFGSSVKVKRIALTYKQVEVYGPPPNPAKETDSRFIDYQRLYGDESWELDALDPSTIVALIHKEIEALVDETAWHESVLEQEEGRTELGLVADNWAGITEDYLNR